MELQKSGKRIVSKGEYVRLKGKRESIRLVGVCLLLLAGILGFLTVCTLGIMGFRLNGCILALCLGIATYVVGKWGLESLNASVKIDPGVPLTHVNVTDLPAPDTLVRASSEPTQEQQTVLLRAVAADQQTPSEQLVRASSGAE